MPTKWGLEGVTQVSSPRFIQNQWSKWKTAASQLISTESKESYDDEVMELDLEPEFYQKCLQMAKAEQTSVSAVVHYILEQYFTGRSNEKLVQATMEQKERNPLLQLDALVKRSERRMGEEARYEHA
ncbi:hypothetical protein [Paenibacillus cremeus]|uniref:Uncharacterized protein n=1 Tax=Paenibacillus cremeus TaxID=2163881 RepID=A0A559KH66_9BACL|nr:hypothetical protein [Paenibacillus cremeus]TVY11461.1 hypothetical protein FPZ49_01820 [Paenibacillus cremeus]